MELSQRKYLLFVLREFAEENRLGDFMICDLRGRMLRRPPQSSSVAIRVGIPCLGAKHRKSSVLPQSIPFPPLCPSVP